MKFEFSAKSVVCYVEDDVCVVSFADSADPEPEKYLIISQALFDCGDDDREISIQYGREGGDVTGGAKSARVDSKSFFMDVESDIVGVSEFRIALNCSPQGDLNEHLKMIFDKSNARLTLG